MRKTTHILLGAAVAMPIAASLSSVAAAGTIWFGMVGGGYPDWFDLRSDFSKRFRHRGFSHSIFLGLALTTGLCFLLSAAISFLPTTLSGAVDVRLWSLAFLLGFTSHLIADGCTIAGVQPLLPFSRLRWWVLPPLLRGRSDGIVDLLGRLAALALICLGLWRWIGPYLG